MARSPRLQNGIRCREGTCGWRPKRGMNSPDPHDTREADSTLLPLVLFGFFSEGESEARGTRLGSGGAGAGPGPGGLRVLTMSPHGPCKHSPLRLSIRTSWQAGEPSPRPPPSTPSPFPSLFQPSTFLGSWLPRSPSPSSKPATTVKFLFHGIIPNDWPAPFSTKDTCDTLGPPG